MDIQAADKNTISAWVHQTLTTDSVKDRHWLAILFGGERLFWADGAFIARIDNQIVGAVTFSMRGEMDEGPEIIGLYVLPTYRRQGVGTALFLRAYEALKERGALRIRVITLSDASRALLQSLPPDILENVDVVNPLGG